MAGEEPLTPPCMETLAQSYVELIKAGEKTVDDVPKVPAKLKPRVEFLLIEPNKE